MRQLTGLSLLRVLAFHLFVRCQAPMNQWWLFVNWTLRNNLKWTLNQNTTLSFMKMHLKMFSAKWLPFWPGEGELRGIIVGLYYLSFYCRNLYVFEIVRMPRQGWAQWMKRWEYNVASRPLADTIPTMISRRFISMVECTNSASPLVNLYHTLAPNHVWLELNYLPSVKKV